MSEAEEQYVGVRVTWSENNSRFAGTRATYDSMADALYLYVRPDRPRVAFTLPLNEHINVDLDGFGVVIGYEILGVTTLPLPGTGPDAG